MNIKRFAAFVLAVILRVSARKRSSVPSIGAKREHTGAALPAWE